MEIPQFLVAAPTSGCGKTTVCRLLMAALAHRGLAVQPFKCGPDYIDTKFHVAACGRPSLNLDSFMASERHLKAVYAHYAGQAEVCVVEGMMGLFDGYDRDQGSSAEMAAMLKLPVVMVVDAKSVAYSMAPLLKGFMEFRPDVKIAGVIFNRVGSPCHFALLQQVAEDLQLPCFGYIPKMAAASQPGRYLGLDFSEMGALNASQQLEHVDVARLLAETLCPKPDSNGYLESATNRGWHMCVARNNESFSFLYQEHIDVLEKWGRVTYFDPEEDFLIPADTDLLYLPGGYPEKHLEALSAFTMAEVKKYAEKGGRVWAECGGMMYLCKEIRTDEGTREMVGVFDYVVSVEKEHRHLSLGYRKLHLNDATLYGHEFHYSQFVGQQPTSLAVVSNARGEAVDCPFFGYKNVMASYMHLYWNHDENLYEKR